MIHLKNFFLHGQKSSPGEPFVGKAWSTLPAIRNAVLERLNNIIVEGESQIVVYASLNPYVHNLLNEPPPFVEVKTLFTRTKISYKPASKSETCKKHIFF